MESMSGTSRKLIGATLPEGLHLEYHDTSNFEPGIYDAQGMEWVVFPDHDTEDPLEWFAAIILKTCIGLGVSYGINEHSEEITVEKFIEEWCGWHEGSPGLTT